MRLLPRRAAEPVPQDVLPRQRQRLPACAGHVPRALRDARAAAHAGRTRPTSRSARSPAPSRCRSACTRCSAPASLLGKRVLVTGGGTIGCMCVIAARLAGAAEVVVADIAERAAGDGAQRRRRPRGAQRPGRRARRWPTAPTSPSKPPAARPRWPPASRPRSAAAASCRSARCRPKLPFPANSVMARELDYVGAFRANARIRLGGAGASARAASTCGR